MRGTVYAVNIAENPVVFTGSNGSVRTRTDKRSVSASERVNQLLKQGLEMERKANLYQEAAIFFRSAPDDRDERCAFQKANVSSWARK